MRNQNPHHPYIQQSKHRGQHHIRKKPRSKFLFTNSSKILPKQHTHHQFMCIIENKKNYQSLIKDQIRKLQLLETNISDPQVQPFYPNNQNQYQRLNIQQPIKIQPAKSIINKNNQKLIKTVRQNKQIDKYLQEQINNNSLKILQKNIRKRIKKQFYAYLRQLHEEMNKQKAAQFFYYQKLTRKCFSGLFKLTNQIFSIDEALRINIQEIKKIIFKRGIKKLRSMAKTQKLNNLVKVFRKTRQFRVKKLFLRNYREKLNNMKQIFLNFNKLQQSIKRKTIKKMIETQKNNQKLNISDETIKNRVKYDRLMEVLIKLRQNKQQKKYNYQNLLSQFNKKDRKIKHQYNQSQIQIYAKSKKISNKNKQKLKIQIRSNILIKKINQNFKYNKAKTFITLLRSNRNIQYFKNLKNKSIKIQSNKMITIERLKDNRDHQKKTSLISSLYLKKYVATFIDNSYRDMDYNRSIVACLTGSKKWLMRNKHIFKLQSNNSLQRSKQAQVNQFQHPLNNKNKMELLVKEGRFKKIREKKCKKMFINMLKQKIMNKKKQQAEQYAFNQLNNHRLQKKVLQIWKSKQKMKQIMKDIDQQIINQLNQQQKQLCSQVYKLISKYNKLRAVRSLGLNYQFILNQEKLIKQRSAKLCKKVIQMFKNYKIVKDNKMQVENKQKEVERMIRSNNLKRLNKLLKQNLLTKKKYIQKNQKIINLKIKIKKQQQFIKLLETNNNITKGSISVTTLYVTNRLKKMRDYHSKLIQFRQIQEKYQQLSKILRETQLQQSFNHIRAFCSKSIEQQMLFQTLYSAIKRRKSKQLIKSLFLYSILFKIKQQNRKKSQKLQRIINNHQATQFYKALNKNLNKKRMINGKNNKVGDIGPKINQKQQEYQQNNQVLQNKEVQIINQNGFTQNDSPLDQQTGFQKYLNKKINKQIQIQQPQLEQDPKIDSQSLNQSQQNKEQLEKNHLQIGRPYRKQSQQQSNQEIPYEQYRKSLQKINKQQPMNQQQPIYGQPQHKQEQDQDNSFEPEQSYNVNNSSNITNNYNDEYLNNRYNYNLTKRYFQLLKINLKDKQHLDQEYQIMRKVFDGLRMYTRQKALVRKYLQQYEQQLHYYPHSPQEYRQFKQLTERT